MINFLAFLFLSSFLHPKMKKREKKTDKGRAHALNIMTVCLVDKSKKDQCMIEQIKRMNEIMID